MSRAAHLALAQRLDAKSPTDRVQADRQRMQQWLDRLLLVGSLASRRGVDHPDTHAAVAEADLFSGHPGAPQSWPAPMPRQALAGLFAS